MPQNRPDSPDPLENYDYDIYLPSSAQISSKTIVSHSKPSKSFSSHQQSSKPSQPVSKVSPISVSPQKSTIATVQSSKSLLECFSDPPVASSSNTKLHQSTSHSKSLQDHLSFSVHPSEHHPSLSDSAREAEEIRVTTEAMDSILEQFRREDITVKEAFRALQDHSRGDSNVVQDYVNQMLQIQREGVAAAKARKAAVREKQREENSVDRVTAQQAANAAAFAVMERELAENEALLAAVNEEPDEIELEQIPSGIQQPMVSLLGQASPSTKPSLEIPNSLLEAAPHLALLTASVPMPSYVQKTWNLRLQFSQDTNVDVVVSLLSAQAFSDPLPQSLLRLIIKDKYVDFDKIHAALNGFNFFHDESKDFGSEFKLVRKEHSIRSLPVTSESQWLRVFEAWLAPLLKIYPHRQDELSFYKAHIQELFRVTPNDALLGIRVDKEARQKAANTPFDLGASENLRLITLKEMLTTSKKRPAPSSSSGFTGQSSSKRMDTPCLLWNDDKCSDPCPNNRKHGICSECGEAHRACENTSCITKFRGRRRNQGRNRKERA
jgi:hypothetical protein